MNLHLITGGSGYVGSHIVKRLLELGEHVRIMDLWRDPNLSPNVDFFHGDVTNPKDVVKALEGVDYVHHTAAKVPLTKAGKNFERVNFNGTKIVIEKSIENKVKHISHISSSAIFGLPKIVPIDENMEYGPLEIYGRSKKKADDFVVDLIKQGKPVSTIRPRTIVGEERLGIFEILFEWIHDNANIFIIGKGDNLFQFIHIEDLVETSINACLMKKPGIFNVGAEEFSTLRDDLVSLIQHAKSRSKVIGLPVSLTIGILRIMDILRLSPLGPWHYLTYHKPFYFDIEKTKKTLEWQPKYSNIEILTAAYDWYIQNKNDFEYSSENKSGSMHRKPLKKGVLNIVKLISRLF